MWMSIRNRLKKNRNPRSQRNRNIRLSIQPLEDRNLMALLGGADVSWDSTLHGWLRIDASRSSFNEVTIEQADPKSVNTVKVTVNGNDSVYEGVGHILYIGGNGEDHFENKTWVGSDVFGKGGRDTLIGGRAMDRLHGGEDVDTLTSGGAHGLLVDGRNIEGFDVLYGGNGDDILIGSWSQDLMHGGGGSDTLTGEGGNDLLEGDGDNGSGEQAPTVFGNDTLRGGDNNDSYAFGSKAGGTDTIADDQGLNDLNFFSFGYRVVVDLSAGGQRVVSSAGKLSLVLNNPGTIKDVRGTGFNDVLIGNGLDNKLEGNGGNDKLEGRGGDHDVLAGGPGSDTYIFRGTRRESSVIEEESGADDTLDFSNMNKSVSVDLQDLRLLAFTSGLDLDLTISTAGMIERVIGSKFGDRIRGDEKPNTLEGGAGNDVLEGREGHDVLIGGADNDTYEFSGKHGLGTDTIMGTEGINTLDFGDLQFGGIQVVCAPSPQLICPVVPF